MSAQVPNVSASAVALTVGATKITVVKASDRVLKLRRDVLLKNVDYMATQIGRLANMAQEMREELLKTE